MIEVLGLLVNLIDLCVRARTKLPLARRFWERFLRRWLPAARRHWTTTLAEATAVHSGSHRSSGVFSMLCEGPRTLRQLTAATPPNDPEWIRSIASDLRTRGLIRDAIVGGEHGYELTEYGEDVKQAVEEMPEYLLEAAWVNNWRPGEARAA